jgi:pimeloyl-ACP methyl ester carboxylesterase
MAVAAALLIAAWPATARAADDPKPAGAELIGVWQGTLNVQVAKLRLVLHVEKQDDGSLKASLDSPDQGAKGLPIDEVTVDERKVELKSKMLQASFVGELSEDGKQLVGKWKQGGQELALTFERKEKAPEFRRPQDPSAPLPYTEEEVTYENLSAEGVKLAGTLTLPSGDGPFPAVVLVSGSGPQDRNESLMGHRPFLVLADHLTRRGIAVLRADDRGVASSTGDFGTATTEDFASDSLAGIAYLKSRKELDPERLGLVGHSEGGLIAPLAASQSEDVAYIVLMAGPGVTGEEIMYLQSGLIAKAEGADEAAVAANRALQEKIFAIVKEEEIATAAQARLQVLTEEAIAAAQAQVEASPEAAEGAEAAIAALKAQAEGQMQLVLTPWFRFFLTYDPRPTLAKVRCPVLAINGEKDLQVDPRQNLPEIEKALRAAGNERVTVREFPGLNHLFQTCKSGSPSEYGSIEETFSPAALECIAEWVLEQGEE